jgi:hypothetical protein
VFLTRKQRITLQKTAGKATTREGQLALNQLIVRLRVENPRAFHTHDSLSARRFIHEPRPGTPFFNFVLPLPKE